MEVIQPNHKPTISGNPTIIVNQPAPKWNGMGTAGFVLALLALFLTCNIPTAAFGGIWLYYKNRHDFQDGLRRMNIQDLE